MLKFRNVFSLACLLVLSVVPLNSFAQTTDTNITKTIPSTLVDTYTISLAGSALNNISALNVKVKLPGKNADITTGITLKATGANVLLSTVTGPNAEEYTISLVLNGMITDGKATITGKFIENSIVKDAQFVLTTITRDGGTDITSSLTRDVTFTNSKATPTPSATATPSSTPSATPTESSSPSESATPSSTPLGFEIKTEAANGIVDLIVSDDGELDIDPSEIADTIASLNKANLSVNVASSLQLKKTGLNRIFARVSGSIDRGFIMDSKLNQLSCFLFPTVENFSSNGDGYYTIADFIRFSEPIFSVPIPVSGSKFRFSKRTALNIVPDGDGLELLSGRRKYYDLVLQNFCLIYDKNANNTELKEYANSKGLVSTDNLTASQLFDFYIAKRDFPSLKTFLADAPSVTLLAPEDITDTFSPQLVSVETDSTGRKILLVFNESLVTFMASDSKAFNINGTTQLADVNAFGNKVSLVFPSKVAIPDGSKLNYLGNLAIKDSRGNLISSFSNVSIVSKKETILPQLIDYKVSGNDSITLYYSEKLQRDKTPQKTDFKVTRSIGSATFTPSNILLGDAYVLLLFSEDFGSGTKKLTYTPSSSPILDLAGNAAPAIKDLELHYD